MDVGRVSLRPLLAGARRLGCMPKHIPADAQLAYWDGENWVDISFDRTIGAIEAGGANSTSDEYTFAPVTGSKVRWSMDNRLNSILGVQIVHGWIYEFEVFGY